MQLEVTLRIIVYMLLMLALTFMLISNIYQIYATKKELDTLDDLLCDIHQELKAEIKKELSDIEDV